MKKKMSRELLKVLVLGMFFLTMASYCNGKLILDGATSFTSEGYTLLTNTTKHSCGQAFNNETSKLKNLDFYAYFIFGIVPEHKQQGSHGMAFVFSPGRGVPGASCDEYLGLFNEKNEGNTANQVIAIELDIHKDGKFLDMDNNHVGININGLTSKVSAAAGYYDDNDGTFKSLSLLSGKLMRLSIGYNHTGKQLNVTLSPVELPTPPKKPLLSLNKDLSPYFQEEVYWGFTASTGSTGALHYVLESSLHIGGGIGHTKLEYNVVPILPPYPKKKADDPTKLILAICLTLSLVGAFGASWTGYVFYLRHKKVKEVLEEWEIQYGPHRFAYKDLFNATKGFKPTQLLGRGGFGQVYKGQLAGSNSEIAVKRTCPDSRQGMNEFLAEISTIGRLRHPNLVRLVGYSRHGEDLYLVYDFMPNGSLEKYLYKNETQQRLTWEQRFKIIKDVASALLHLHKEWVQVIIHRDVKPANVLMDREMNAVLGDFGLAKLHDKGVDAQPSQVAGTMGYMAPEFMKTGRATTSTDVYAFGLVILEVICGRRLIEHRAEKNEQVLLDWIVEIWEEGRILDAAEECILSEQHMGEVELALKLGVLCSHQSESIRPDVSALMQVLNGDLQLPENILDIVTSENLRPRPEISVDMLFDMSPRATLSFSNSFTDQDES